MPDKQETFDVIAEGMQYALQSLDGGSVYVLNCKEDRTSARLEGDELAAFLLDFDNVRLQYPNYDTDQVLAQLWDEGGYSWMAVPDEA